MKKIRIKIVFLAIIPVILTNILLGFYFIRWISIIQKNNIENRLTEQAKDWRITVESYEKNIQIHEKGAEKAAREIIKDQVNIVYEMIDKVISDNNNSITENQKEDLFNRLSQHKVGRDGYIGIMDYKANYILSKDRVRDGENIWEVTNPLNGEKLMQKIIKNTQNLEGKEMYFTIYEWQNKEETVPRKKIAGNFHIPEMGWIVGITAYFDDVIDTDYRRKTQEEVKDLIAKQVIARTGYIWVVNSEGIYQVSKNRGRDGEDISQSKDNKGQYFIQNAIKKAKSAGNDAALISYPWKNPTDKQIRTKVAGLTYFKDWDWIVGVSAYYDDFTFQKIYLRNFILISFLCIFVSGFIAYEAGLLLEKNKIKF